MAHTIKIYSTPTCHYCHLAKDLLTKHNISFQDINVATDINARKEMVEKTGQMGVPVIDVDGQVMVGFDENALKQVVGIK